MNNLITKKEACKLAIKTVHTEIKHLEQIEFDRGVEFTLKGIKIPLQEALKKSFEIEDFVL